MTKTASVFVDPHSDALPASTAAFAHDLAAGLSRKPYRLSPKYFYDAAGSALFDRICALPEYYLTRTETGILARHAADMAAHIGPNVDLIEFGAGSMTKVRLLLDAFASGERPARYLPVDISGEHLRSAARSLSADYPNVAVEPVIGDYTSLASWPDASSRRRVGFFPGSTLGNFESDEALAFLRSAAGLLRGGGLLIGVDLVKDPAVLHAAYNDQAGVTAAFNLNLLARANRELGADFDLSGFAHYAFYQPSARRIEMHLVSTRDQAITFGGQRFVFNEGDSIHTEHSHKYSVPALRQLALSAGFVPRTVWLDADRLFSVHWLEAPPS